MNWRLFIVELVKATAWPLSLVIISLILPKHLARLGLFLRKFKYNDLELEFNKEISEIKKTIDESPAIAEASSKTDPRLPERFVELAAISPSAAIFESWKDLEAKVIQVSQALHLATKGRKDFLAVEIVRELERTGKIEKKWSDLFARLREIRNSIAHKHDFSPDASFALDFVDAAEHLKSYLDQISAAA